MQIAWMIVFITVVESGNGAISKCYILSSLNKEIDLIFNDYNTSAEDHHFSEVQSLRKSHRSCRYRLIIDFEHASELIKKWKIMVHLLNRSENATTSDDIGEWTNDIQSKEEKTTDGSWSHSWISSTRCDHHKRNKVILKIQEFVPQVHPTVSLRILFQFHINNNITIKYQVEYSKDSPTCEHEGSIKQVNNMLVEISQPSNLQSDSHFTVNKSELSLESASTNTDKNTTKCFTSDSSTKFIDCMSDVFPDYIEMLNNTLRRRNESDENEYIRTSNALEIINAVGHTLSLISITCIAATAIVFRKWRQELSNKILLNMAAAILLNTPLFFVITYTTLDNDIVMCLVFGAIIHYSVLASFCWMLVMSGLQLMRLVTLLGAKTISHLLLKVALFGWCTPLIPVIVLLSWDTSFYTNGMDERGYCFPQDVALLATVRAPLYVILTINVAVFVIILCRVYSCFGWGETDDLRRHGDADQAVHKFRTSIILFFLLGLPWTIGYFDYKAISFAYLYSITTSNQGVMLFVFFVVLDKKTRRYWKLAFRRFKARMCNLERNSTRSSSSNVPIQIA